MLLTTFLILTLINKKKEANSAIKINKKYIFYKEFAYASKQQWKNGFEKSKFSIRLRLLKKKSHFFLLEQYNYYVVYRMNLKALFSIATFMTQFVITGIGYKILTVVSDCCQGMLSNNLNNLDGRESV